MNFKLLNIAEAFPKIMRAKVRSAGKSGLAVTLASKGSELLAQQAKFGKAFSNKIADSLTKIMPHKLEENGIHFNLKKVHCGTMGFVVLRAEVVDVDLLKLLEKAKGTEFAERFTPLVGMARKLADIDRHIVPKLQHQIMLKMEKDIPPMMKEKAGFKMVMIAKPSSEQADFFFDALTPHRFEIVFEILNRAEVAPKIAHDIAQKKFGRAKLLVKAAGAVASHVVASVNDQQFGKLVARRLADSLPGYMADAGVMMAVTDGFTDTDQSGRTILQCEIADVDLCIFRPVVAAAHVPVAAMTDGQHFLKLGAKGRTEVYHEVRNYVTSQLPKDLMARTSLQCKVVARDVPQGAIPKMEEITLSDSDSDA